MSLANQPIPFCRYRCRRVWRLSFDQRRVVGGPAPQHHRSTVVRQTHFAMDVMSLRRMAELLIAGAAFRTLEVPKADRAIGDRCHAATLDQRFDSRQAPTTLVP